MQNSLAIGAVRGLTAEEQKKLNDLQEVYNAHILKNQEKSKYYDGHISLQDVNLGIALPKGLQNFEIGCEWGAKTVDVLASRSMFDGFVGANGTEAEEIRKIADDNRLVAQYKKACRDELKYGSAFATLSKDQKLGCRIRFHSPEDAAAIWNGEKNRIDCGLAIVDTRKDESDKTWRPSVVNLYTENAVITIRREAYGDWVADRPFQMHISQPLMVPMSWNATMDKPFGRSRLKAPIRGLIQSFVRTMANMTIALEFATTPQKYLLGITDEQYDNMIGTKFRQYVGSMFMSTTNPETGTTPEFGQLPQGSITQHIEMLRAIATQFSAATGLSVTDTGVVNDANPTSSDAVIAQEKTLIATAEELNQENADALHTIARMAQAISRDCTLDALTDEENDVVAHFRNPAMPSVAVTTDAAIKVASCRPEFGSTDVFLEMVGFDQADIRRIKSQERRVKGLKLVEEMQSGEDQHRELSGEAVENPAEVHAGDGEDSRKGALGEGL